MKERIPFVSGLPDKQPPREKTLDDVIGEHNKRARKRRVFGSPSAGVTEKELEESNELMRRKTGEREE